MVGSSGSSFDHHGERLRRTGEVPEMPERPLQAKSDLTIEGKKATFRIPPPGFGSFQMISLVMALPFLIFLFFGFLVPLGVMGSRASAAPFLLMGVFAIAAFGSIIKRVSGVLGGVNKEATVTVTDQAVHFAAGNQKVEIPLSQLEELEIVGTGSFFALGGAIRAVSDERHFTFGGGLAPEELRWIRDTILCILAAV